MPLFGGTAGASSLPPPASAPPRVAVPCSASYIPFLCGVFRAVDLGIESAVPNLQGWFRDTFERRVHEHLRPAAGAANLFGRRSRCAAAVAIPAQVFFFARTPPRQFPHGWHLTHTPGQSLQNPLVERVIAIFDTDGDGEIDFEEFIKGIAMFSTAGDREKKLRFAFQVCLVLLPLFGIVVPQWLDPVGVRACMHCRSPRVGARIKCRVDQKQQLLIARTHFILFLDCLSCFCSLRSTTWTRTGISRTASFSR